MKADREEPIRALYSAATGQGSWPGALAGLAELAQSQVVTLDTYDFEAHAGQVWAANVVPDRGIEEYNREFGHANFQIEAGKDIYRAGSVLKTSDFICQNDLLASDLFQHVYRPMGIRWASAAALEVSNSKIVEFSFMRAIDAGDHSDRNIDRIRQLTPHLQQAWAGYSHLQTLEASLATLTGLWDQFNHPVIVVDASLRLRFANRAAEALFRNGRHWRIHHGLVKTGDSHCQERLKQGVQRVASGPQSVYSLSTAVSDSRGTMATLFQLNQQQVALILTDPARSANDFRNGLQRCFGLTATEADLVKAMISDETLRQFADSRKICYETARTHLKNAMRKNGWRRQGEMVSAVLRTLLPPGMFQKDQPERPDDEFG